MSVKRVSSSTKNVITSSDIQVKYEQLYKFLMDFLWEFRVVQDIANLELAIFKRFPDKEEMAKCLRDLKLNISYTYNELSEDDETEFEDAVTELEDAINNYDDPGCELYAVEEVIDDPNDITASDKVESEIDRRKFKIGNIKKLSKEERELQEEAARTLSNPFETTTEEGEE